MKKIFFLIFIGFGISTFAQIQKGKVIDRDGNPIENAYLINSISESHAHSNEFGIFSLDKTVFGNVIKISALGYKKLNYTIASSDETIILEDDIFRLNEIVIQPKLSALNVISKIDLETTPVNSSQEILRKVPGLFIGQHAGGGKAEQIFLRGFDIDHGTDISISVDGMPVNMVSHAHGQGYADLHFVIPIARNCIPWRQSTSKQI